MDFRSLNTVFTKNYCILDMPEHVELQHLVDGDLECQNAARKNDFSVSKCKSCPYLGLVLATLSSLFFSLCSVIVKGLVEVRIYDYNLPYKDTQRQY